MMNRTHAPSRDPLIELIQDFEYVIPSENEVFSTRPVIDAKKWQKKTMPKSIN